MFNLTKGIVNLGEGDQMIKEFQVWFRTPMGLFPKLGDALLECNNLGIEPEMVIVPVPVALSSDGKYEVLVR